MIITRRQALIGASGLLALPAFGQKATSLRNGELLPPPDFSALRESNPYVIGVRPHRKGGVRLELEAAPLDTPSGQKFIIHNYGHGGGGITLSWGCASLVADLVEKATALVVARKATPSVAILGTGIAGLTVATELRRKWPELAITVYAKDLAVSSTTSFIAGGQFEPSGIYREYESDEGKKVIATMLRRSRDRIVELQNSGQRQRFGVAERKNYTLNHENKALDVATPLDVVAAPRIGKLPFAGLNVVGREYSNWLMNPSILLPTLAADLAAAKVAFTQRTFATKDDVATLPQSIVINCTGYGAKQLFSDENVIAQRGHLVVLKKTDPKQFYFFSGGCSNKVIAYAFCRQDDVVLGGTVIAGEDSLERTPADDAIFQRLLSNGRALFGGKPAACKP